MELGLGCVLGIMPGREFCFTLAANSRRRRLLFASIMEEQGQSALLCSMYCTSIVVPNVIFTSSCRLQGPVRCVLTREDTGVAVDGLRVREILMVSLTNELVSDRFSVREGASSSRAVWHGWGPVSPSPVDFAERSSRHSTTGTPLFTLSLTRSRSLSRAPQKSHFSSCPRRAFRNHHQARMDPPAPRPDSHARVTDLPRLPTLLWLHRNLERNARSPIGPPPDHIMHRQAALESEPAESDAVFQHALTLWL
ncbi:uncharacterized protein CIMG_00498 [Coccidioides immitis RS]|uniref:Uncharacterized protein n=1 Tax=Coccidioides immitis (strain RS) TaxID=246410 RepID=A0A0E1RZB6_COCIM|nr:uncharacterized protein CIMG_00498 [Coccidioides immitis RS]EAS35144.1 hypothetical protein CIMG_00498 [Coccidioides immitis RS]